MKSSRRRSLEICISGLPQMTRRLVTIWTMMDELIESALLLPIRMSFPRFAVGGGFAKRKPSRRPTAFFGSVFNSGAQRKRCDDG
ncbi:hypothetical protein Nepgr_024762 [Nepenthes gracilis]|uniref:Uncharacterized protein n=1 Tax=Nepenthes gracilis TaxID=150966 RepID=A0AAD3Y0C7_NEPGR|nr:hypothetical protein Nepgr_024762 [Nepenthes gracilis]